MAGQAHSKRILIGEICRVSEYAIEEVCSTQCTTSRPGARRLHIGAARAVSFTGRAAAGSLTPLVIII